MSEIKKPDAKFFLKVNGEDTEIKMSFALLQEIMKVIQSPENVASLLVQDFYLREYVVRRVLTGNKRVKNDEDLVDLFTLETDEAEMDDLVLWITDHVLHFFMKTVARSVQLGEKYQTEMQALRTQLNPSPTGSDT